MRLSRALSSSPIPISARSMCTQPACLLLLVVSAAAVSSTTTVDTSGWRLSTLYRDQAMIMNGGVVHDSTNPNRLFAASVTKPSLWEFDFSEGRYTLLAGDPQAKGAVVDGIRDAARFNQPRDMCQLPGSGDLLVVDGIGSSAVVRYVSIATGTVTTVLGNPTGGSPTDSAGSKAILSSGAWSVECLADGTAILVDRQLGAFQHICPPGSTESCKDKPHWPPTPDPSPPQPPPPAPDSKHPGSWWGWLLGVAGAVLAVGGAGYGGSVALRRQIAKMRSKHVGPGGRGIPAGAEYRALPHDAAPQATAWLRRWAKRVQQPPPLPVTHPAESPQVPPSPLAAAPAGPATATHAGGMIHAQQLHKQLLPDAMTVTAPGLAFDSSSSSFISTLPYEPQQTGSSSSSSNRAAAAANDGDLSCTADLTGSSVRGCDAVSWPMGNPTGGSLAVSDNSNKGASATGAFSTGADTPTRPTGYYAPLRTGSTVVDPEGCCSAVSWTEGMLTGSSLAPGNTSNSTSTMASFTGDTAAEKGPMALLKSAEGKLGVAQDLGTHAVVQGSALTGSAGRSGRRQGHLGAPASAGIGAGGGGSSEGVASTAGLFWATGDAEARQPLLPK